mmetsp:Transcript_87212/g.154482  ORF Transcript_87212/g.154482 Transcript_87212/m.154482 type:complete len:634 (-) Transcript_87212:76-1977(-)
MAAARPAASGRNVAQQGFVPAPKRKNTRTKNAYMLRENFKSIQDSPDGADMDPLTLPKCVECGNCGFPVYPRDSKVATKKTFARAGIERSSKKEEEAKRKAAIQAALEAGEDIPEELLAGEGGGDASEADSRDTVERMADELQDLQDANEELEKNLEQTQNELQTVTAERDQIRVELEEATDRIEFLEEAEERWRDKLTKAKLEIERLLQVLERASYVSADREGGLIASLLECRNLREQIAILKRRRALMLLQLQQEWKQRQNAETKQAMVKLWSVQTSKDTKREALDQGEARRRKEVAELQEQLSAERARVKSLEATVSQLEGKCRQAAHRLLERSASSSAWPHAASHALRAWCGIHPALTLENELERTQKKLADTEVQMAETNRRCESLEGQLATTSGERDGLIERVKALEAEILWIKEEAGLDDASIARRKAAEQAKEDEWNRRLKAVQDKLDALTEEYAEVKEDLEKQLKAVQSRLQITEDALAAATGGAGGGSEPDAFRVVPNGQGIVCTGCLKQMLLREVRPIPPKGALSASVPQLETARRAFFKKGLGGRLQTDDELQNKMWNDAKDPYRLSKLNRLPNDGDIIRDPSSPSASVTTTGLPSLKKGSGGGTASMKTSMKDFRPRAFR